MEETFAPPNPTREPETVIHYEDADGDRFMVEGPFRDGYRFSVNGERVTVPRPVLREMVEDLTSERNRG